MARLASNFKGGFYPAPPEAVSRMLEYIKPPSDGGGFCILDPCAGKGAAIKQLSEGLGCRPSDVYAIELSDFRTEIVTESLPEANLLAPCSFFGCSITSKSFGFAWVNPPFADEAGEGRVERQFLEKATGLLAHKGILAFVIPEATLRAKGVKALLMTWYEDLSVVTFPSRYRKFKELVVVGRKRKASEAHWELCWEDEAQCYSGDSAPSRTYEIPSTTGPNRFLKTGFTEAEILEALDTSPLRRYLEPPEPLPLAEPPLPLGKGHRAMLLAAGQLDGIIRPPGEPPHIVRGTAKKVEYIVDQHTERTNEATTTKITKSEKISLTVRVLSVAGRIKTLAQN